MSKKFISILGVILIFATPVMLAGQTYKIDPETGDTINFKHPETHMRQGHWVFTGRMKKMAGYEDDQVVEEGDYKDNRKNGIWKRYFPNKQLRSEVHFTNNKADGDYKEYYADGTVQEEGTWKNNKNVGNFVRRHPNGTIAQEFAFNEKGKREGTQTYYFDNGQVRIKGDWAQGQESGVVTEYTSTGEIKSEKVYGEGGVLDAEKTKVYEVKEVTPPPTQEPELVPVVENANEVQEGEDVNGAAKTGGSGAGPGVFTGEGQYTLYRRDKQISKIGIFHGGKLWKGKVYNYNKDGILIGISIYKKGKYQGEGVIEHAQ